MTKNVLSRVLPSGFWGLLAWGCGASAGAPPSGPLPDGAAPADAATPSDSLAEAGTNAGWRHVYAVAAGVQPLLRDATADVATGRYFAVGYEKAILVGRGEEWTPIAIGSLLDTYAMPRGMFERVWAGSGHVWAIGALGFYAGGAVEIGNGDPTIAVGDHMGSGEVFFGGPISAIGGTTNDVWLGGSLSMGHFDGTTWTMSADDISASAFAADPAGALWATAPEGILRKDANQWETELASDTGERAVNLWIADDASIFVVGYAGPFDMMTARLWVRRAGAWSKLSAGADLPSDTGRLAGVWGTGSNDVFVVGDRGALFHFDGVAWQRESIATTEALFNVTGMGSQVIAVGADGIWQRN